MIKRYDIDTGVEKSRRLLHFALSVLLMAGTIFAFYATHKNSENGANEVLAQAVETPAAVAAPVEFTAPVPWPGYGHAAYVVPTTNQAAASDPEDKQVPVASLAKVITALAILKKSPLQEGQHGPAFSYIQQDVAIYEDYVRKNGSVAPIEVGHAISQYQALQAIILISANNIADSQVIRTFGSMEAYIEYANAMVKEFGLTKTVVADASGYSPNTVSTAKEMAQLGHLYMQNPVLRQIALQESANIPVAGKIRNYNAFMNEEGMVGIKVGDTDQAGKCFIAANMSTKPGEKASIAVVLGAENLRKAAEDAKAILLAGEHSNN